MLLAQAGEPGARRSRHLRRLGGGLGGDVGNLCGDLLGGAGGLEQNAGGVVDGKLCEVVGIEADLDDGAMPDAGDRILIAVQLDPTVLADGAACPPQEQSVEGIEIGDAALIGRQAVAEAGIGALAGSGEDAGVVVQTIQAQKAEFNSSRVRMPATWASRWNWFLMILLAASILPLQ